MSLAGGDGLHPKEEPPGRVELIISNLLRLGVIVSLLTLISGLLLVFAHHPSYLQSVHDLQQLTGPGAEFPHSPATVATGLLEGRGQAVIALGLILLILTPILRVVVSIGVFAVQQDRKFVRITTVVLVILLVSFLLGQVE